MEKNQKEKKEWQVGFYKEQKRYEKVLTEKTK